MLFLFLLCKIMVVTLCRTLYSEHKTDKCLRWGPFVNTEGEWNLTLFSHLLTSLTPSFLNLSVKIKRPSRSPFLKCTVSARSPGNMLSKGSLERLWMWQWESNEYPAAVQLQRRQAEGTASSISGLSKQGGGGQGHPWHRTQRSSPLGV